MPGPADETWALHTDLTLEEVNLRLAALEAAGYLGVAEVAGRATVHLPTPAEVGIPGRWERIPARDWSAEWKAGIEPVTVGRVTVVPPWLAAPDRAGHVVVIEPAQAFGTGGHETTTACLAALQEIDLRRRSLLDVGTGTGVLALAAARLGAAPVVAVDVDPLAVEAARHNATLNGEALDVRLGSVDAADGVFDVVVANLDTATLSGLADQLAAATAPGGAVVASGVSNERQDEAVAALTASGLRVHARTGSEWSLLLAGRRA